MDRVIGLNINFFRKKKGVTQVQLCEISNVQHSMISKYERGMHSIRAADLFRIALALEVPIGSFFYSLEVNKEDYKLWGKQ